MNKLLVATRNLGKLKEIKSLLRDIDVTIISFNDIDKSIDDIDETGTTFKDNAIEKAREVAKKAHCLTLADDSGLCIDALEGAPGVYSARFAGSAKDNEKNRQKVLFLMKEAKDRHAQFKCAIALALPEKIIGVVEGACDGLIAHEEKGMNGFGYDSIFYYPPFEKTFAELTPEEKGRVSHRGEALAMTRSIIIDFLHNRDNT